jgi:hypothetical protein
MQLTKSLGTGPSDPGTEGVASRRAPVQQLSFVFRDGLLHY